MRLNDREPARRKVQLGFSFRALNSFMRIANLFFAEERPFLGRWSRSWVSAVHPLLKSPLIENQASLTWCKLSNTIAPDMQKPAKKMRVQSPTFGVSFVHELTTNNPCPGPRVRLARSTAVPCILWRWIAILGKLFPPLFRPSPSHAAARCTTMHFPPLNCITGFAATAAAVFVRPLLDASLSTAPSLLPAGIEFGTITRTADSVGEREKRERRRIAKH